MNRPAKVMIGAACGIILGLLGFAVTFSVTMGMKSGLGAGLGMLVASPLYVLLYIVVLFTTMLPAGLLTGVTAGICSIFVPRIWNYLVCTFMGFVCGGYFGVRLIDISLEHSDTRGDLIAGGIAAALFFAISGVALCKILSASSKLKKGSPRNTSP